MLFASNRKIKSARKLNIKYKDIKNKIRRLHVLSCVLDETLSRKTIALKAMSNVYSAWYPNVNEKLKTKTQIAQNKCIRFSLKLYKSQNPSYIQQRV